MPSQGLLCWNTTFHSQISINLVMDSSHLHILLSSIPTILLLLLLHSHSHLSMFLQTIILANTSMVHPNISIISIPMAITLLPPCLSQCIFPSLLIFQGMLQSLFMLILGIQGMPLHTMTSSSTTTS